MRYKIASIMESLVLEPLSSIGTHLNALVTSLTQTNTFANAPQIAQDLLADDDNLVSALSLLQRHQQNYARILNLREEVATLQEQLRDTVRKCVSFKQEIGQINPSILDSDSDDDDADEEDDTATNVAEVDYHTLLTFAARIGKHNTIAAKEAEAEAVRRKIAAKNAATSVNVPINGIQSATTIGEPTATQDTTVLTVEEEGETSDENGTAETTAELSRIDNAIAIQRAQMGMSFPDAALLRTGALGQLQLFRERQEQQFLGGVGQEDEGIRLVQEAVDKEVERMVRETEDIAEETIEEEVTQFPESPVFGRRDVPATTAVRQPSTSQQGQAQRPPKPTQSKKKLDLDFPDSDDEDDE